MAVKNQKKTNCAFYIVHYKRERGREFKSKLYGNEVTLYVYKYREYVLGKLDLMY